MYLDPTPTTCAECSELLTAATWGGLCIICSQLFCRRHLRFRHGVANCAACDKQRRTRETTGGISDDDETRVASLVLRDIASTLGTNHDAIVEEAAARIRLFAYNLADFEQRVVDDVQQCIHDWFIDTTWPACPYHPNHPLWYSESRWRCEQNGQTVAPLGRLTAGHKGPRRR